MPELSPAAQAVLDAWESKLEPMVTCLTHDPEREALAAALRAAADQVVPEEPAPEGMRPAGEVYSAREIKRRQRQDTRHELLAIAAELEAQ